MGVICTRELLRAVLDGTIDATLLSDDDGRYVEANTAACTLFGMSREDLLRCRVTDFRPADGRDPRDVWRAFLESGRLEGETVFTRPDGLRRTLIVKATANVAPGLHLSVLRDVTTQRLTEQQLQDSESLLETAQALAHVGSWVTYGTGTGRCSPEHARICGVPVERAIDLESYLRSVHPDDREGVRKTLGEALAQGRTYDNEYRIVRPGGEVRWVHSRAIAEPAADGQLARVVGALQDVTERRQLMDDLRASEQRYRRLIDATSEGVLLIAPDGRITLANARMAQMLGCTLEELVGQSTFRFVEEADQEAARERLRRREDGFSDRYVSTVKRTDGTVVWVSVKADPVLTPDGRFEGTVSVIEDLSERRAAEETRNRLVETEEQLRQSQKMEAIGVLAGGVAHDFNNLLAVILSFTGLLLDGLSPDDARRDDVEEIGKAASQAALLTRQLLAFSRRQVLQPCMLDMNQTLLAMQKMLRRLLGEDIALSIRTADALGHVHADPGQIEQVVMNLVVNARDAMPRGGNLTIDTANVDLDACSAASLGLAPGAYVRVGVTDDGCGMDAATQARIFEPFFTTKGEGRGTGLGLSTVFGIVKQSAGHVAVRSAPGCGTTFHVYLPCKEDGAQASEASQPAAELGGNETILLVEDDEQVRKVVERTLHRRGYRVLEAQNAGEALLIADKHDGPIHLLLTDVVMPRVSGRELAERLVAARPGLRVLFMSGYTEDAVLRHGVLQRSVAFVHKPFTPDLVGKKVREVLDEVTPRQSAAE